MMEIFIFIPLFMPMGENKEKGDSRKSQGQSCQPKGQPAIPAGSRGPSGRRSGSLCRSQASCRGRRYRYGHRPGVCNGQVQAGQHRFSFGGMTDLYRVKALIPITSVCLNNRFFGGKKTGKGGVGVRLQDTISYFVRCKIHFVEGFLPEVMGPG